MPDRENEVARPIVRVEAIFGPMLGFEDDLITRHLIDFGAHTRPELAFLSSIIHPGDFIFDLGAHIGTFSIPLAKRIGPTGKLLAVEPSVATLNVLFCNLALNGLADQVIVKAGLIAPPALYASIATFQNSGDTFFKRSNFGRSYTCFTIDALAEQSFVPNIIKLDLEGYETWALTTSKIVGDTRPIIYTELYGIYTAKTEVETVDLIGYLSALGYRLLHNIGARNAALDEFIPAELTIAEAEKWRRGGEHCVDILAIPEGHPRLSKLQ